MAETPEPKGEQWLKAFARKRRGQMPPRFELHSADRARLQREVQRQYDTGKQGPAAPGWRGLLPRLVLAGAVAALAVALAANFLLPPLAQRRTNMARASADKKEVASTPAVLERELVREDSLARKPSTERVEERL